jgi:hypothetical protein
MSELSQNYDIMVECLADIITASDRNDGEALLNSIEKAKSWLTDLGLWKGDE